MNTATPALPQQLQHVIVTSTKSIGISILLTILFGPVGLFYASVRSALILLLGIPIVGSILAALVLPAMSNHGAHSILTLALGYAILMWPASIIWGAIAVRSYNRNLARS